ncbi:coat protein [ssRNA phage Gerhypos.2_13]|uniref:Coat protein n=2 Tax=Leviviricetes TaxID=2842243 RepID=A0A8S5KXJ2_9VIRU|nr:coat protein [ssRNA phage Gerhypos.2_13]QDH91028.1 MAG: hypothetical protein H2Bulk34399_000002 [Leviviridae sp.]DAD50073.1 TPA_asm: coat protein [ssRNA phage Gerhypos.2_13]
MFASTITLTLNSIAKVLNRNNQDNGGSRYWYKSATESIELLIRHSVDNPTPKTGQVMYRHNVFVERVIFATPTTIERRYTFTATIRESYASDPLESGYLAAAVTAWLGTSTNEADLIAGIN